MSKLPAFLQTNGFIIAAPRSGVGKTLASMALLWALKKEWEQHKEIFPLQSFKIGPDYIDGQFHAFITQKPCINLDIFLSQKEGVKQLFSRYARNHTAVIEGVMGFYDSCDKGVSTFDAAQLLELPVLLLIPAGGQSHTLLALLKGLLEFRKNNHIKGIILNHVASETHYFFLKSLIEKEFSSIKVYGYFLKDLPLLASRHLGLDLNLITNGSRKTKKFLSVFPQIARNLDIKCIQKDFCCGSPSHLSLTTNKKENSAFFSTSNILNTAATKHLCIVKDAAFSFAYTDDINFFQEIFQAVSFCSSLQNQKIPATADVLWIPGGYVETKEVYKKLARAKKFRKSLHQFCSQKKPVYAECAGMIFLSEGIQLQKKFKKMAGFIPMRFQLQKSRVRLGYYTTCDEDCEINGHAFHYSRPLSKNSSSACWQLWKNSKQKAEAGAWRFENIFVTYLHIHFRSNPRIVKKYFLQDK